MIAEIPIKGFVVSKQAHITSPIFSDKHIQFFQEYLNITIKKTKNGVVMTPAISHEKIKKAIYAYQYEFGEWNK